MKKLSESIFNAGIERNQGNEIKNEDKFNPDYMDLGSDTTVYWMKENLVIDGESRHYYDDIKDYNNNGWRLPTKDEVLQIHWNVKNISWYDGATHLKLKEGFYTGKDIGSFTIHMNDCNGFHMWAKDKESNRAFCYGYDNGHKFNTDYYSININKLYVFLVKDK